MAGTGVIIAAAVAAVLIALIVWTVRKRREEYMPWIEVDEFGDERGTDEEGLTPERVQQIIGRNREVLDRLGPE